MKSKGGRVTALAQLVAAVTWPFVGIWIALAVVRRMCGQLAGYIVGVVLGSLSWSSWLSSWLRRKRLQRLLVGATSYAQYVEAARELGCEVRGAQSTGGLEAIGVSGVPDGVLDDISDDGDTIESDDETDGFDAALLRDRLHQLRAFRAQPDPDPLALSYLLRSSLSRNLGGMGNPSIYSPSSHSHSHSTGNKTTNKSENKNTRRLTLIHSYIDEVVKAIDFLESVASSPSFQVEHKIAFFKNLQRSFGTTALLLSGGATFGMIHVGVLKVLVESNSLPRIISGSSAGSIVAALLCCQTDDSISLALDPQNINRDFYESPSEVGNIFPKLYRFMNHGCIFDVEEFIKTTKLNLGGDITFQEAYNKSRRVLNIAVSSSTTFEMPRLLNYLTAPNVVIWSAVAASCALPLIYRSAPLMCKTNQGKLEPWNPS
ncbi:hypothetical protein HK100_009085, partial [Physocladia obscura]